MINKIEISNLDITHYKQLLEVMKAAYINWTGSYWSETVIEKLISKFPEGQFVIIADEKVVGCALSIMVKYDDYGDDHTYKQITGNYTFSSHNEKGDVLYGIEVFIHPDFRGLRLGRRLYDARKELCEKLNLKAVVFGGRIPNYHTHAAELKPKEYIKKVKLKEIYDPVLSFQLSNDFHVKKVLKNYLPEDNESQEFATLLQWDNVYYIADSSHTNRIRKNVRLGLVQWKMRLYNSLDELFQQAEYFIDSISNYKADFVVFPEYFNGPLMAEFNDMSESDAMRAMAQYTHQIRDKFSEFAVMYNVNIIAGSMPLYENNSLKNVGYVCHRNGKVEMYEKLHITPDEEKFWGLKGGNMLQTYDTDSGKIGVLICYDVEFPELARLLADEGVQILFVPYLTDTQNSYLRVRLCAQARAIENECYVAITGSVGILPKIDNLDIQYSQSAVFTPSDFAFPSNAVKSEATANTEMVLISDVDLKLLDELHAYGSVRNLKDRRKDFYELKKLK
ncbi:MAG: bifunctional GNAT family N-acetyltransferase/carbon-nitrogen hydrolase family protein [Ferruginibacter sp.]